MPPTLPDLAKHYGKSAHTAAPRHLGTRYDRSGAFLGEPGNTVVCHLVEGSATQQALIGAQARFRATTEAGSLAFTPVESYHMTLFQGIIEGRRTAPHWPTEVAGDTAIDAMTALFLNRLELFEPRTSFAVEVTAVVPTGLIVDGVTAADRHAMADWRNGLAEVFGYRHPDHDSYQFHITMAYMIDWLSDAALPVWDAMLEETLADIRRRAPIIELRAPAFCSFKDMNWFEELRDFGKSWRPEVTEVA
jgi:hypothetical protein